MKSTIIIDAGSTKMEWAVLEGGVVLNRFTTKGFNPNYTDIQELKNILAEVEIPNGEFVLAAGDVISIVADAAQEELFSMGIRYFCFRMKRNLFHYPCTSLTGKPESTTGPRFSFPGPDSLNAAVLSSVISKC